MRYSRHEIAYYPRCEQTENITFPQPSDAVGKNMQTYHITVYLLLVFYFTTLVLHHFATVGAAVENLVSSFLSKEISSGGSRI